MLLYAMTFIVLIVALHYLTLISLSTPVDDRGLQPRQFLQKFEHVAVWLAACPGHP